MINFFSTKLAKVNVNKKLRKIIHVYKNIFGEKDPGEIKFDFEKKLSRISILQNIIDKKNYKNYLEIGTFKNELFSQIKCKNKVGVDPFSGGTHRMTSDEYFLKCEEKFDIIFIDGLHHYEQVKKDIQNSLKVLKETGIILIHDCLPKNLHAQTVPRTVVDWNGDVWKAFVEIRTNPNLDSYTCYADHGIGVIFKRINKSLLKLKIKNFKKLKFLDFYKDHKNLMNIIEYEDLIKIV